MSRIKKLMIVFFSIFISCILIACDAKVREQDFTVSLNVESLEVTKGSDICAHITLKNTIDRSLKIDYNGSLLKYKIYNENMEKPYYTDDCNQIVIWKNKEISQDVYIDTEGMNFGRYFLYAYVEFEYKGQIIEVVSDTVEIVIQ